MICFNEQTLIFMSLSIIIVVILGYKYISEFITLYILNKLQSQTTTPTVIQMPTTAVPMTTPQNKLQDLYIQTEQSRLYNPFAPPARRYDQVGDDYNVVGYIFNTTTNERYALFAKNHDATRSDRKDYYIIDDKSTRFNIKIPVETRNYAELFDGDTVTVDSLGTTVYTVKIYSVDQYVYNPNLY